MDVPLMQYGERASDPASSRDYPADEDAFSRMASRGRGMDSRGDGLAAYSESVETRGFKHVESIDYLPPNNATWRQHIIRNGNSKGGAARWSMMAIVGFSVGLVGYILYSMIDLLADMRYKLIHAALALNSKTSVGAVFLTIVLTWFVTGGMVLVATALVVHIAPQAAGSGVPEVMAYLNGCLIRKVFNIRTLVVKFFSCMFAVASGLPVGPEGPMIHIGAMLGAGISQGESTTLGFAFPLFPDLRNSKDKRDFITAGVAAGVAVAFGTPIGGLLFAFEEIASFWQKSLGWQIFFACMCATFALNFFKSAEYAIDNGHFGLFSGSGVIFEVSDIISTHALALIPSVFIGFVCGLAAVAFIRLSRFAAGIRKQVVESHGKFAKMLEPVVLGATFVSVLAFLPVLFPCKPVPPAAMSVSGKNETWQGLELYICKDPDGASSGESGEKYNEMASLVLSMGEDTVRELFNRSANQVFGYYSMTVMLTLYTAGAAWCNGTALSSGLFVPMLVIGSLIGRLVGLFTLDVFVGRDGQFVSPSPWAWINPGVFALIGAGAFMGGVTRLTVALAVIIIEMSSEVHFVLPIMAAIMTAKWIADMLEPHSIYEDALFKDAVPFLAGEHPQDGVELEILNVSRVMHVPVVTVEEIERISTIRSILKGCSHNGFPVVSQRQETPDCYIGFISRAHMMVVLRSAYLKLSSFDRNMQGLDDSGSMQVPQLVLDLEISYEDLNRKYVSAQAKHMMEEYDKKVMADPSFGGGNGGVAKGKGRDHRHFENVSIDLRPFVNTSAVALHSSFSLSRAYILFRTLGLRHLTIITHLNQVSGICTRKDLTHQKLKEAFDQHAQDAFLTPRV